MGSNTFPWEQFPCKNLLLKVRGKNIPPIMQHQDAAFFQAILNPVTIYLQMLSDIFQPSLLDFSARM